MSLSIDAKLRERIRALPDSELRGLITELVLSTKLQQSVLATARREQTRRKRAANRAAKAAAAETGQA